MKRPSATTRIFILAGVGTAVCLAALLLLSSVLLRYYNWPFILLLTFSVFVVFLLSLYYFYFVDVSLRVNRLSEKIRQKFSSNEIPRKRSQLEEDDSIDRLEERVDL